MDVQQFEQAILKMAFETDAKITTASVAYYLGIPSRRANQLLENLLETGVLELDSDGEGNLYYFVPNPGDKVVFEKDDKGDEDGWRQLESAADAAANAEVDQRAGALLDQVDQRFRASLDSDGEGQSVFSPAEHSPYQGADGRSPAPPSSEPAKPFATPYGGGHTDDDWFQYRSHNPPGPSYRPTTSSPASSRFSGLPRGATSRLGRPDASPDRCGTQSVIVDAAASCDARPLADARPTVTSCNDVEPQRFSHHQEYGGFGFAAPTRSTALATTTGTGELALTADNHIDQPEHQPGMALLLSLILCGTGQIYNGEVSKGIIMLILCFLLWFVFLGWVVHIWSIVDAVVVAERINRNKPNN